MQGYVTTNFYFSGDGGTDGATAVGVRLSTPYLSINASNYLSYNMLVVTNPTYAQFVQGFISSNVAYIAANRNTSTTTLAGCNYSDFSNGNREWSGSLVYKAF